MVKRTGRDNSWRCGATVHRIDHGSYHLDGIAQDRELTTYDAATHLTGRSLFIFRHWQRADKATTEAGLSRSWFDDREVDVEWRDLLHCASTKPSIPHLVV